MRKLTDLELDIIMILADNKGHALWEIAKLLGKEKSNLIIILNRLEDEIESSDPLKLSWQDIINPKNLEIKFYKPNDLLSQYIQKQFKSDTVQLLNSSFTNSDFSAYTYFDLDKLLEDKLLKELNILLNDPNLFEEKRFAHIALNEKIREMIYKKPKGQDLRYLNRLLLEEAYPEVIAKSLNPMIYKGAARKTTNPKSRQPKHTEFPYFITANPLILECIISNFYSAYHNLIPKLSKEDEDKLIELRKQVEWHQISKREFMKIMREIYQGRYTDENREEMRRKIGLLGKFLSSKYTLQFVEKYGFKLVIFRIYKILKDWDICSVLAEETIDRGIISNEEDFDCAQRLVEHHKYLYRRSLHTIKTPVRQWRR